MSREIAELSRKWWANYQKFGKQNALYGAEIRLGADS
jgi:hypothetical protein